MFFHLTVYLCTFYMDYFLPSPFYVLRTQGIGIDNIHVL